MIAFDTLTAAQSTHALPSPRLLGTAEKTLKERFPPRPIVDTWPMTAEPLEAVMGRLEHPPLRAAHPTTHDMRRRGARKILQWLDGFPGDTWQQRWNASPAATVPGSQWSKLAPVWIGTSHEKAGRMALTAGMLLLTCADVLRPSLEWQISRNSTHIRSAFPPIRDPEGFAHLEALVPATTWSSRVGTSAQGDLIKILAAKGGKITDITVGDALEFLDTLRSMRKYYSGHTLFYSWLHKLGQLPEGAPGTLRHLAKASGQVSVEQLVDRYNVQCKPVRDLLVDYLKERQPALDYNTLETLSRDLVKSFWTELEHHHPGIDSLRLPPEMSSAWKQRLRTKVERKRQPDGSVREIVSERANFPSLMITVRAFYLDISQWAIEEPGRWGLWAAPCPIGEADVVMKKHVKRVKAKMDQRTRERLPALPAVARAAKEYLDAAKLRLEALAAAPLGGAFTVLGQTFTRTKSSTSTWAFDDSGHRRMLGVAENRAFWTWATIEFLQHTGARIEEMMETSHHSLIQYKLPTTGEIVPLLQIAPSKMDEERLILVSPELADVLSTIISRVRDRRTGAIPHITSYDPAERVWNPPMPLLFQWEYGGERSSISQRVIRHGLNEVLDSTGLTDSAGRPLDFDPHDFRRIFITDAIRSGLPPHIAQVIAGHGDINTTMGYNAIYPAEAIEAHRAFIARRRATRPSEEYRTPTNQEWDAFLGHFERRKLSIGICARAFGTACVHEHACVRCSMLRPDPAQRPRLVEIRDNLIDRIAEAEREGWLGEIEGLDASRAGAEDKLAQVDAEQRRSQQVVDLGMPTFSQLAGRTV
ncbi:tyrosine-type recombinase/integrase [Streptomyces sp. NPDC090088]|uniref:tyrosine-type recombinase/integrase n=1 Tax=Streptomyces sp. NPDC090088 TaxID=3365944 RepID=UPI00381F30EA